MNTQLLDVYYQHRSEMKTGDVLLYKPHNIIGHLISLFSPGFCHAGFIIRLDEYQGKECRVWTLEAVGKGVVLVLLSTKIKEVNETVIWYPLQDRFDSQRRSVGEFALEQAGKDYDWGVIKAVVGKVSANARALFCSELVFMALRFAKILFGEIAYLPADLAKLLIYKQPVVLKEVK